MSKMVEDRKEARYRIGCTVCCGEVVCGELSRVIVDPIGQTLTHLVVSTERRTATPCLVPIDLVEEAGETIQLACTPAEFDALERAVEVEYVPTRAPFLGYEPGEAILLAYYGLRDLGATPIGGERQRVVYDRVPIGEVDIRRGEHVKTADGGDGRIKGLVVDPRDRRVTHVLLEEGLLWGKKEVAISIGDVTRIDGGVHVNLTSDQVRALAPVEIDRRYEG